MTLEFEDPRDGHKYRLVEIGGKIWFAENLAYIPHVSACNSGGGIWVNGYNWKSVAVAKKIDNYYEYGCLYDFTNAQLSCPSGWRLPTRMDFDKLLRVAGGVDYDDRYKVYRNLCPGGSLGFNGLFGGGRRSVIGNRLGSFTPPGEYGDWWSCERAENYHHGLYNQNEALGHTLHVQSEGSSGHFFLEGSPLTFGLSVRCIKI